MRPRRRDPRFVVRFSSCNNSLNCQQIENKPIPEDELRNLLEQHKKLMGASAEASSSNAQTSVYGAGPQAYAQPAMPPPGMMPPPGFPMMPPPGMAPPGMPPFPGFPG